MKWLIPVLVLLLIGTIVVAVLYAAEESAPAQPTTVELDIDRAKPRPPLKQKPAKPAPKRK